MKSQTHKKIYMFYCFFLLITCLSFVFTNISYDAEYQMAMAYRMIKGDALITEMWEPHQTSAFLCAILMKLYMMVTGTTTGIVLYIQAAGLFIRVGISLLLYKVFKKLTGEKPAVVASVVYFLISPKDLLTPEFGNMQLWFATLMFLALIAYLENEQVSYLIIAAVCLCLGVFSYPSFIISYLAVFFILWKNARQKMRDIALFTGVCAVIGGSFAGYLLWNIGLERIIACVTSALALEPSHTVNVFQKVWGHGVSIVSICGLLAVIAGVGFLLEYIRCLVSSKKTGKKEQASVDRVVIYSGYILFVFFFLNILSVENRNGYGIVLLAVCLFGFAKRYLLSDKEKRAYDCALWISIMSLVSTLILSDHPFLPAVPYMLIAVCASVMPLYHWFKELVKENSGSAKMLVYGMHAFLLLLIFRALFIHIPMYGRGQICSVLDDLALIRSGPAIGIITDEEGAARQRDSMKEWKQYIQEGDTIWILGEPVDTLGYLYEDVEVGAPTVMSTPTYNEHLLYYWELNPEKYPDVIILASSFGELSWDLARNNWLMEWLEEEYQAETIIDGNYWRYYFKEVSR